MSKTNTPIKGEQKRDITEIAEAATSWIEKQAKVIVSAFIVLSLVLVCIWVVSAMNKKNENKVAKAAGIVNRKIELLQKSIAEASPKVDAAQEVKDKFETRKNEEINKLTDEVKGLISSYPSKVTTSFSTVKWAKFLVENKQEEKAMEILKSLKADKSSEFTAVPVLMKASLLAKAGKNDEAMKIYDDIIDTKGWTVFSNEALIQKAAILQGNGEIEKAIELLSKVNDENENSKFVSDSKKYLRLLKLNQKVEANSGS